MEIIYLLIPLSILLLVLIVSVFLWALRSGQFDDLDGPAQRILFDEDLPVAPPGSDQKSIDGEAAALKCSTPENRN